MQGIFALVHLKHTTYEKESERIISKSNTVSNANTKKGNRTSIFLLPLQNYFILHTTLFNVILNTKRYNDIFRFKDTTFYLLFSFHCLSVLSVLSNTCIPEVSHPPLSTEELLSWFNYTSST